MVNERKNIVEYFADFLRTNIPLLIFDEMWESASLLFQLSGQSDWLIVKADEMRLDDLPKFLGDGKAFCLRRIEKLPNSRQKELAKVFGSVPWSERGKLILTTDNFEEVAAEIKNLFCKIDYYYEYQLPLKK